MRKQTTGEQEHARDDHVVQVVDDVVEAPSVEVGEDPRHADRLAELDQELQDLPGLVADRAAGGLLRDLARQIDRVAVDHHLAHAWPDV